jgi:hypothetical protein
MAEAVLEKLSREDIIQQYAQNLVFYKGQPVYVVSVDAYSKCNIKFIKSGEEQNVPFSLATFKAPICRLGLMNIRNSVVHLSRIPVRRMNIGLNGENLVVQLLPVDYPEDQYTTVDHVRSLHHKSWIDVFEGNYPTFAEALEKANKSRGACAFDRQFAVDKNGNVFYKTKKVGSAKKSTEVKDITFDAEFVYLSLLLEGNHEKTVGISCS